MLTVYGMRNPGTQPTLSIHHRSTFASCGIQTMQGSKVMIDIGNFHVTVEFIMCYRQAPLMIEQKSCCYSHQESFLKIFLVYSDEERRGPLRDV